MKTILSTKKLQPNQRDLLLGAGYKVVDYNAIDIQFLEVAIPSYIENAIFTSQNAVKSIHNSQFTIHNLYCVGQKTKTLLEENNFKVLEVAKNAEALAQTIIKNYKNNTFHFFCGTLRRNELPELLQHENIVIEEIKTYNTELRPKKFEQNWDGILFFSPSGVESYFMLNTNQQEKCICIGETTGQAAKKYYEDPDAIVIANATTVESVIAKAVHVLK